MVDGTTGPVEERFWAKVDVSDPDGCWTWEASSRGRKGYGSFDWSGRSWAAHRISYMLATGRLIDTTQLVLHHCDNPPCVRPDHLYLGDFKQNTRDMILRGRGRSAKIDQTDAEAIRREYAAGFISQRKLAARYGLSQGQISRIVRGLRWTHKQGQFGETA